VTRRLFVVFGDDWGRHVSSIQHLFRHVVGRADVVWVDSIGHRSPTFTATDARRAWEKVRTMVAPPLPRPGAPRDATPGPRVVPPRVLPWHALPPVRWFNRASLTRQIRQAIGADGRDREIILVTNSPPSAPVVGRLGERISVYFCMDDYLTLPGTSPGMLGPLEQQLLARVDAVVVTARALLERKQARAGRGYYLPQGVNYEHFATPRPVPAAMAGLPRPIIGFAGGIGTALDVPTLEQIADAIPEGTLALVGPIHEAPAVPRRPNVVTLGAQPYSDLPAYVQAFDVGIIPYVDNAWTRAVDPLKLLEYLAAGIPVVAAPLPEVDKYASVVTIAALGAPFAIAVRAALGDGRRAERQAVARENQWEARADRFLAIIDEVVDATRATASGS
jgi:glycosyltransferase involved in cell wall biosynthesis